MKLRFAVMAFLSLAIFSPVIGGSNPHNVFTIETKDDVSSHTFLENGKYFFVRADDILHFFDGENGKQIWTVKI